MKIDPEVDLAKIARGTPGFSGADLANIINEAAIIASKTSQETVTIKDFEEARDKIIVGKEIKTILMSDEEKKLPPIMKQGMRLVLLSLPEDTEPLHKITIIPRGRALGVTWWLPERDKYQETKRELLASIRVAMGGRAAEDLVFEDRNVTTGCYSDFVKATELGRKMVCYFGMSAKIGPVIYGQNQPGQGFNYSEGTAQKIDEEVHAIMDECYKSTRQVLSDNREKLDKLAQALLEKETLYAEEIYQLLEITPRVIHSFS